MVTSCPSHTLSPLTPHLSLFHRLFHNSLITSPSFCLSFYSLLQLTPFSLLHPHTSPLSCSYKLHLFVSFALLMLSSPSSLSLSLAFCLTFPPSILSLSRKRHYSINPPGSWLRVNICIRSGSRLYVPLTNEESTHTHTR